MVALGSPVVPEVKPRSATSSRPVWTASNATGLFQRQPVELGIVVRGAVEADDGLQKALALRKDASRPSGACRKAHG